MNLDAHLGKKFAQIGRTEVFDVIRIEEQE